MDTSDHEPEPMKDTVPPAPPEAGTVHPIGWEWGREEDRRPQLPWIGLFILIYGVLLLVNRLASQYLVATNLLVLAAGLAFMIVWLLRRGTFPLYAGAFLTASTIPGLVGSAGYNLGEGFGTLCYGVALLFIGLVRFTRSGGIGWQVLIGMLLVALGGSQLALPDAAGLVLPILLVVFGLVLLTRDRSGFGR
ncbi:MAG: hypothetical protein ABIZ52_00530 [Candidatus Limnocylindrales bacterium]